MCLQKHIFSNKSKHTLLQCGSENRSVEERLSLSYTVYIWVTACKGREEEGNVGEETKEAEVVGWSGKLLTGHWLWSEAKAYYMRALYCNK